MKNDTILDNNNRCIYCGDVIPEGRQLCCLCEDILLNGRIRIAGKSRGMYHRGHIYFTYAKGNCCIDLTLKFGKGNEPKSLTDERLKSCINLEYYKDDRNHGKIVKDNSIMKFLAKNLVVFYILSFTWGFITSLIGLLILLPLIFAKRVHRTYGRLYGVFPKVFGSGWAFNMGCFFFVSHDSVNIPQMDSHEMGHGLQNILFGPLMLFVVNIPSTIRFWYRHFKYYRKGRFPETLYDDIWFEWQASFFGAKYITNLYTTNMWP